MFPPEEPELIQELLLALIVVMTVIFVSMPPLPIFFLVVGRKAAKITPRIAMRVAAPFLVIPYLVVVPLVVVVVIRVVDPRVMMKKARAPEHCACQRASQAQRTNNS
jgi:heme/copper-type cytochrome/quinol oxidase subunit 2